jgi:hypothetical protein
MGGLYIDFWNGNTEGPTRLLPFIRIFELAHYETSNLKIQEMNLS